MHIAEAGRGNRREEEVRATRVKRLRSKQAEEAKKSHAKVSGRSRLDRKNKGKKWTDMIHRKISGEKIQLNCKQQRGP